MSKPDLDWPNENIKRARGLVRALGWAFIISGVFLIILGRIQAPEQANNPQANDLALGLFVGFSMMALVGGLFILMISMSLKETLTLEDPVVEEVRRVKDSQPTPPSWYTPDQALAFREGAEAIQFGLKKSWTLSRSEK